MTPTCSRPVPPCAHVDPASLPATLADQMLALDDFQRKYVRANAQKLEMRLAETLREFASPLTLFEPMDLPIDAVTSLESLAEKARTTYEGTQREGSQFPTFDDPPTPAASEYVVAGWREYLFPNRAAPLFATFGYRAATLRETLCMLGTYRDVARHYGTLVVFGTPGTVEQMWNDETRGRIPILHFRDIEFNKSLRTTLSQAATDLQGFDCDSYTLLAREH